MPGAAAALAAAAGPGAAAALEVPWTPAATSDVALEVLWAAVGLGPPLLSVSLFSFFSLLIVTGPLCEATTASDELLQLVRQGGRGPFFLCSCRPFGVGRAASVPAGWWAWVNVVGNQDKYMQRRVQSDGKTKRVCDLPKSGT